MPDAAAGCAAWMPGGRCSHSGSQNLTAEHIETPDVFGVELIVVDRNLIPATEKRTALEQAAYK